MDTANQHQPVELPINGVLDLHTFRPNEVKPLIADYIAACQERGICHLRIIHGKGTGALREYVHAQLQKHNQVAEYRLAGENAGGWGATLVQLKKQSRSSP